MPDLTLPAFLFRASSDFPDLGITYVDEDGSSESQTYADLLHSALALAGGLQSKGLQKGDIVIIATSENQQTIQLLWACFLSGIVPTILQPPVAFTDDNPSAVKLMNVYRQLGKPRVFLSSPMKEYAPELAGHLLFYHDILPGAPMGAIIPDLDDLAFIQYSSGSTGDPKGIRLTHRNIALNIEAIIAGIDLQPTDHGGNWMPLYHDMGLIGYHLTPIVCPCQQYHIETIDFIKNPALWLEMMSVYKISVSGCPNFGQALVLRHLKRKAGNAAWDFSPMKALLNGAEPISIRIMEEFIHALKPYGFREEAMMPVYGMAEATLAISFSGLLQKPVITSFDSEKLDRELKALRTGETSASRHSRSIISVGKPVKHLSLRIVNEEDIELPPNTVGHIQVRGDSVTSGYYQQTEATEAVFHDGWLVTGDLGFIFEEQLYISGRYKDIIFLNGRNYFAHDLENVACTLEELNYGKVVFGGLTDPRTLKEKVLAFVAGIPEAKAAETMHQLKIILRKKMGVSLDEMVLVRSNDIPKTSSGKIQRYRLLQRYIHGEFHDNRIK